MSSSSFTDVSVRSILPSDREDPYLRVAFVTIFVRNQDRSLRFYLHQLGFGLILDHQLKDGTRWLAVAPPDGTAMLALVTPEPDSEEYKRIGQSGQIAFITEDVMGKFDEWNKRGVHFGHPPRTPDWGGMFTSFEDPDGNSFALIGFDEETRRIEAQRRAIAEKLEAERRAAQEMEIAPQVQSRLFPQKTPRIATLDYAGICIQARQVGGDYYDFLELGRERLGLVIGDIAGKGIAAALLMASLQASLRGQSAIALDKPERLLQSANQLFYENTSDNAYATLFFAEYDENLQHLRYANCGHLPGLLLRGDGVLWNASTRPVPSLDSLNNGIAWWKSASCLLGTCSCFTRMA